MTNPDPMTAEAVERLRAREAAWNLNSDNARVSIKLGDLRTVLAALSQAEARVKAAEEGLGDISEVSGDRATLGFNEGGRLRRINEIARSLLASMKEGGT